MSTEQMNRATGLLIIEVINSNPNGDPDRESDPRQRPDERGEISPVSFKRKLRDLVEDKTGPVWLELKRQMDLKDEEYMILEHRGRDRKAIEAELKDGTFVRKYWDARLFGNTFLEEGSSTSIKTGAVQFGMGVSIAPILIERQTTTNKSGVQEGKDRGMAPLSYRIVQHGVYSMPFFVNSSAAQKSGCTKQDVELMLKLIPYAYPHNASYIRPAVEIRHAWYMEHQGALGSCSDFSLIESLTPQKLEEADRPSTSWKDYQVPTELPQELAGKLLSVKDLMKEFQ
ncbi:MAG: type I CRISPR-associated protein Cas7 [Deltaproteobacteria bacterium]|nr:type I CRISPR-associated protein Cas7 [Deltaproteobacteria bacterium]